MNMKRVILSFLGGLVLPVLLLVVLGTITDYLPPSVLTEIRISDLRAPRKLLLAVLFLMYPNWEL